MKKLLKLFLFVMLVCVGALSASAYTVTIRVDNASAGCRYGNSLGPTGYPVSWTKITNTFSTYNISGQNFHVGASSNSGTLTKVVFNGEEVSKTGNGKTTNPNRYSISLKDGDNLVEIYTSSSTAEYTYPVNLSFTDESDHVTSITSSKGTTNITGKESSCNFKYGETITVKTDKQATTATYQGATVNPTGSYSYTFSPFPNPTTPTFTMEIPGDNVVYNLSATADDASCILGYTVDDVQTNEFKADQPIKVYTAYEPVSYYGVSGLTFARDTYNGTDCYSASFTAPAGNVSLNFTFNGTFTTNIDGAQHIYAYTATDAFGNTRELAKTGDATFHKGDVFTLYSKYVPTSSTLELAWESSTYNGTACNKASFAPTAEGSLTMSFAGGTFYVTIQDDEDKIAGLLDEYFAGYQAIHDDNTTSDLKHKLNSNDDTFSPYGTCNTDFSLGDTYVLYLRAIPEAIYLNGAELEGTEQEIAGETYVVYTFTPTAEGRLNITFGSPTAPGPVVEETFKVYIKADVANVVNAQVRATSGNTDILIGTGYTEVECPVSGYIYCTILDEGMYSFQSFKNTDENVEFLDYDPPTTYPVTIRQTRATSDTEMITNSDDHFTITTNSKANLQWYTLNLNIADDASNVRVEVGTSYAAKSPANRVIDDLQVGDNTVSFSEEDTYLVVSSKNLRSLYEVTFDKATVTKTETWPAEFYMSLSADAADGHVVVTANEPIAEGDKEFTLTIDHPELVVLVRRFVNGSMTSFEDIDLSTLTAGANTLKFAVGDEFRVQLTDDYAVQYVRWNGTDIAEWNGLYDFRPAEGDNVVIYYGTLPELPKFTVVTDRPDMVTQIYNFSRGKEYPITEEYTDIEFVAGNTFQVRLGSLDPKYVTFNDATVGKNGDFYEFTPTADGTLKVIFNKVPAPQVKTFTLTVDDASKLVEVMDDETEETLFNAFVDGDNNVPVGSGSLSLYVTQEATLVTVDGIPAEYTKKGKYYEISVTETSVVIVKFKKDPTFTLIVDDPAKMAGFAEAAVVGSNNYTFTDGQTYSFSVVEDAAPICAKVGDTAIEAVDGVYTFAPADGDVVKVFFNHVPACTGNLYTVKATFANEGSEDVIRYIYVDNAEVALAGFIGGNVLVDEGADVSFNYKNHDYIVNSITVNDSPRDNTGSVSFIVNGNSEVVFDVRKPAVINYTIVTDAPEIVEVYYPDSAQQSGMIPVVFESRLDENENVIDGDRYDFVTNEFHPVIVIKKKAGVEKIVTVTNNSVAVEANEFDQFIVNLTDGDVIVIDNEDVEYENSFVVILDIDTENCLYDHNEVFKGIENTGTLTGVKSGRTISLVNGRNVINFNSSYDGDFLLGFSKMPGSLHTYVDAEEIETDHSRLDMFYLIHATDGTLVRSTYHASAEVVTETIISEIENEETGEVTYQEVTVTTEKDVTPAPLEVDLVIDEEIQNEILILRDLYQVVYDFSNIIASSNEPLYTMYSVFIREGHGVHFDVYRAKDYTPVASYTTMHAPAKAEEVDYSNTNLEVITTIDPKYVPEGYNHVCSFNVNQPVVVGMVKNADGTITGVDDVAVSTNVPADIYNINGVKVKANASDSDLNALPAGFYIYGGRKIMVK